MKIDGRDYRIGAVVYDEDQRMYRKANPLYDTDVEWAVYEDGSFCDVYPSSDEARKAIKELRS